MGWPETGRFKGRPPSLFQEAHLEHVRLEILLFLKKRGKGFWISLTALARELGRDVETIRKVLPKVVGSAVDGVAQVIPRGRDTIIMHGYREGGDPIFCDHGLDGYILQAGPNQVVQCPGCGKTWKSPPITIDWLSTRTYFEPMPDEEFDIEVPISWDFKEKTRCILELGQALWSFELSGKGSTVLRLRVKAPNCVTTLPLELRLSYVKDGLKKWACSLPIALNVTNVRSNRGPDWWYVLALAFGLAPLMVVVGIIVACELSKPKATIHLTLPAPQTPPPHKEHTSTTTSNQSNPTHNPPKHTSKNPHQQHT